MSRHPAQTPCLGDRVAALADGSLRPDVRDRALAHTLNCPPCRLALEAERRTVAALRSLGAPPPSPHLVNQLIALGGADGPLRPRRAAGPGMPRPAPVPIMARPQTWPAAMASSGRTRRSRLRPRTVVAVAAGAGAVSFVAAGMLAVTTNQTSTPTAQMLVVRPAPTPSSTVSAPSVNNLSASNVSLQTAAWAVPPGPSWALARWTPPQRTLQQRSPGPGSATGGAHTTPAASSAFVVPSWPHAALAATSGR